MQPGRIGIPRLATVLGFLAAWVLLGCQDGESMQPGRNSGSRNAGPESIGSFLQERFPADNHRTQPLDLTTVPRQSPATVVRWKDLVAGPEARLVVEEALAAGSRVVFTDPRAALAVADGLKSQLEPNGWRLLEVLEGPAAVEGNPPSSYFFWFWRPHLSFQPQHLYEAGCAHIQTIPQQAGTSVHLGSGCHLARTAAVVQGARPQPPSAQDTQAVQDGDLVISVGREWSVATPFDSTQGCSAAAGFRCLARQDLVHEQDGSDVSLLLLEHQPASGSLDLNVRSTVAVSRRLHPQGIPLMARAVETVNDGTGYHVYLVYPEQADGTETLVSDLHFASEQRHLVFSGTLSGDFKSLATHGTMLTQTVLAVEPVPAARE